jgi:hypothetical protein
MNDPAVKLPPVLPTPYAGVPEEYRRRAHADVSAEDWNLIKSVCPLHGTVNALIGIFFKHITNELRKQNIATYNPDALIAIVSRCAHSGTGGDTPTRQNTGGTPGVSATHSSDADQSTDTRGPAAVGGGGPNRGNRKSKTT